MMRARFALGLSFGPCLVLALTYFYNKTEVRRAELSGSGSSRGSTYCNNNLGEGGESSAEPGNQTGEAV
jgi:hypothetical protein